MMVMMNTMKMRIGMMNKMRTFNKEGTIYSTYNNYWVDSELGDDINGDGSYETPFRTVEKVYDVCFEELKKAPIKFIYPLED